LDPPAQADERQRPYLQTPFGSAKSVRTETDRTQDNHQKPVWHRDKATEDQGLVREDGR